VDNNELLSQIKSLLDAQTEQIDKRFAEQDKRMDHLEARFDEQDKRMDRLEARFDEQGQRIDRLETYTRQIDEKLQAQRMEFIDVIDKQTQKLSIIIENSITKRIDALFDARDISLEKDKELEGRTQKLEAQVDNIQTRVSVLEAKTASAT